MEFTIRRQVVEVGKNKEFDSIQKALFFCDNKDADIIIYDSIINENIELESCNNIKIISQRGCIITSTQNKSAIRISNSENIDIENIVIENILQSAIYVTKSKFITLKNLIIFNCAFGLQLINNNLNNTTNDTILIENCTILKNSQTGIISNNSFKVYLKGNIISKNKIGIEFSKSNNEIISNKNLCFDNLRKNFNKDIFDNSYTNSIEFENLEKFNLKLKDKKFEDFGAKNNLLDFYFNIKNQIKYKTISELHDLIFEYLYKKNQENQNFRFTVRSVNRYKRLEEGYWFHGNDEYLGFSFWEGMDNSRKTPNIFIYIYPSSEIAISITAVDSGKKSDFLKKAVNFLDGYIVSGENQWYKYLGDPQTDNILDIFENFIKTDKIKIDNLITIADKKELDGIDFIENENFKSKIDRILSYKNSNNDIENQNITENVIFEIRRELKIKSLTLKNISLFSDLKLDFHKKLTCFIGENGCGKSTIIKAIALAFIGVNNSSIKKELIKNWIKIKKTNTNEIQRFIGAEINLSFFDSNVENKINFMNYGAVIEDATETFISSEEDNLEQLMLGFSQAVIKSDEYANENKNLMPNINDISNLIYDKPDNYLKNVNDFIIFLEKENKFEIIHKIFEIVNEITEQKIEFKYVYKPELVKDYKTIITDFNNLEGIPIDIVSQGIGKIISWIGLIVKRFYECSENKETFLNQHAILLIDEIDTYLHPKWQRRILNVLLKYFPSTQFVVTTHSPLVVSNIENEVCNVYKLENNLTIKTYPFGKDLNTVYFSDFEVEKRNNDIQILFDEFYKNIELENIEEAGKFLKILKTRIIGNDSEILKADTMFNLIDL